MHPNNFLVAAIAYLCANRPGWGPDGAIGKTAVSSAMIDRLAAKLGRRVLEVPVGFKWFSDGLSDGSLAFAGEESAGATFLLRDGTVWTTDKDGLIMGLLAAEISARTNVDPASYYLEVTATLGVSHYARTDAPASRERRALLAKLAPANIPATVLAGATVLSKLNTAPGNAEPLGGIKVVAKDCWFAARPSGTENVYNIYAEDFRDAMQLKQLQDEVQDLIADIFGPA